MHHSIAVFCKYIQKFQSIKIEMASLKIPFTVTSAIFKVEYLSQT